jgi:predicted small lipoprotein YifL
MRRSMALALAALTAAALTGCGKQGALERPRPLIGIASQPTADARKSRQAAARARTDTASINGRDPQAPQSETELRGLGLSRNLLQPPAEGSDQIQPPGAGSQSDPPPASPE